MTTRRSNPTTKAPVPELGRVVDALIARDSVQTWLATAQEAPTSARARVPDALRAPLLAALALADGRPLLVAVDSDEDAEAMAGQLEWYLGPETVAAYVGRGTPWGSGLDPAPFRCGRRAHARAVARDGGVVVASAGALLECVPAPEVLADGTQLGRGQLIDRDDFVAALVERGYRRVERVEAHGELAVRGDIVDVFGATDDSPHRIEFFDDEVEAIRRFSVYTQRSLGEVERLAVWPAAEVLAAHQPLTISDEAAGDGDDEHVRDPLLEELLKTDGVIHAMDAFTRCRVVRWQPQRLDAAGREAATLTGLHGVDPRGYAGWATVERRLARGVPLDPLDDLAPHRFHAERPVFTATGFAEAENDLAGLVTGRQLQVVVAFIHGGMLQRVANKLRKVGIEAIGEMPREAPATAWSVLSEVGHGFVSSDLGLALVPSTRLFRDRAAPAEPTPAGPGRAIAAFTDLKPGDHVVHEDHGIGRFARFETRTVAGVTRDYLYIEFAGEDRLYIPHEQIHKITRYIGADGSAPKLSRFGGKRWQQLRNRATRAVRELAGELLALYAQRARAQGLEHPPDAELVARFEAAFPYEETPDQARAITAVEQDLARPQPMDRLVCGDVGFGKTEVAMRAAAHVVSAGRQVMVLVPTTVLAQQHLKSFRDRFHGLPVEIDMVSRFRSRSAIDSALERFRDGRLDILIGTHRLLSRDVMPKQLGLVVVDEEQRFGVQQKEMLRQMRTEVDVLAMSATPIPRTLHMSLAGLRDISVIETAPRGRRSISTYVGEYEEALVREAIERELARDGQVFYLHNRVQSIDEAAVKLSQIVPDARVRIGHGQMGERELERVMSDFVDGDFDVLVSTTIIESGLDIPAANTLIVERADVFGLSQLHQIRGRVGRSDRSAHAYLLYPSRRELTDEARARLTTLGDYSELGAGTRIAMRDLEIRGAGNLLGAEQSGHVAAIGFELYVELLAEAIAEISGEPTPSRRSAQIDVRIDAYIPADYVYSEAEKIELHRRMGLARDESDLSDLAEEMVDRYGEIPEAVQHLVELARLRLALADLGANRLSIDAGRVVVQPVELDADSAAELRVLEPSAAFSLAKRQLSASVPRPERQLQRAFELLANLRTALLR